MPDKYLEKLLNDSKAGLPAKQAKDHKKYEAERAADIRAGRNAAQRDYQHWRSAIEGAIGRDHTRSYLTLTQDSDSTQTSPLLGYRKTIFGNYKTHFYYMAGFRDACKGTWTRDRIEGYVSELQKMLGGTFNVSSDAGGYRTYKNYYAGIENDDGSGSSMYTTESFNSNPSVTVRW